MATKTSMAITPSNTGKEIPTDYSFLFLLPLAAVAVHHFTKKQLRRVRRKMLWLGLKIFLILLGVGFIAAMFIFLGTGAGVAFLVLLGLGALIFSGKTKYN
jgi:hypothetical protein